MPGPLHRSRQVSYDDILERNPDLHQEVLETVARAPVQRRGARRQSARQPHETLSALPERLTIARGTGEHGYTSTTSESESQYVAREIRRGGIEGPLLTPSPVPSQVPRGVPAPTALRTRTGNTLEIPRLATPATSTGDESDGLTMRPTSAARHRMAQQQENHDAGRSDNATSVAAREATIERSATPEPTTQAANPEGSYAPQREEVSDEVQNALVRLRHYAALGDTFAQERLNGYEEMLQQQTPTQLSFRGLSAGYLLTALRNVEYNRSCWDHESVLPQQATNDNSPLTSWVLDGTFEMQPPTSNMGNRARLRSDTSAQQTMRERRLDPGPAEHDRTFQPRSQTSTRDFANELRLPRAVQAQIDRSAQALQEGESSPGVQEYEENGRMRVDPPLLTDLFPDMLSQRARAHWHARQMEERLPPLHGHEYGLGEIFHAVQNYHQSLLMEPPRAMVGLIAYDEEIHWNIALRLAEYQLDMRRQVHRMIATPGPAFYINSPRSARELVEAHQHEFFEDVNDPNRVVARPILPVVGDVQESYILAAYQAAEQWPRYGSMGWDAPPGNPNDRSAEPTQHDFFAGRPAGRGDQGTLGDFPLRPRSTMPPQTEQAEGSEQRSSRLDSVDDDGGPHWPSPAVNGDEDDKPYTNGHTWADGNTDEAIPRVYPPE